MVNSTVDALDSVPGDRTLRHRHRSVHAACGRAGGERVAGSGKISVPGGLYTLRLGGPGEDAAMQGTSM